MNLRSLFRCLYLNMAGIALAVAMMYTAASADIVVQFNPSVAGFALKGPTTVGQSLTTPTGGPWNNITFNWYQGTPIAFGDLFLMSQEYLGIPTALSSSTPGFIAESTGISGGKYLFAPGVTLQHGTQYWFYSDTDFGAAGSKSGYLGGMGYFGTSSTPSFPFEFDEGSDVLFSLEGTPVPEPSSLILLGAGLVGLTGIVRKKLHR